MRNLHLTFECMQCSQKYEDFAKFCGPLRIYELYKKDLVAKETVVVCILHIGISDICVEYETTRFMNLNFEYLHILMYMNIL